MGYFGWCFAFELDNLFCAYILGLCLRGGFVFAFVCLFWVRSVIACQCVGFVVCWGFFWDEGCLLLCFLCWWSCSASLMLEFGNLL